MFSKPYKLKSSNTLKNSEKKHLVQRVLDSFDAAKEDRIKELIPVKSSTSCLRLVLNSGDTVAVYAVDNVPVMVETETTLVPTVCALWKVPELVPTIIIHSAVLPKILGGAPLYLPGVEIPHHGIGFPMFAKGSIIAACTIDNIAAGVVGRAAMGSADMLLKAGGMCLETIQVWGDLLCKEQKFGKIERPKLGPAPLPGTTNVEQLINSVSELSVKPQPAVKEEWPALGRSCSTPAVPPASAPAPAPAPAPSSPPPAAPANLPALIEEGAPKDKQEELNDSVASDSLEGEERGPPADMDGLLRWCLLCFLRLHGKHLHLPLKTNLLYKNHLFPLCPPDRTLDVKKSTYKKMSKFLEAMQREGLVEVCEVERGVDALVSVNLLHPLVRAHALSAHTRALHAHHDKDKDKEQTEYVPPQVREMWCVTAAVTSLFPNVKKGTPLSGAEVRAGIKEYVQGRQLAAPRGGAIVLDAALASLLGKKEQETAGWEEVWAGVCARMTASTQLVWAGEEGGATLLKTRLQPVTMQLVTRSGNKKVTLVNNLESYGFSLPALARTCQLGVGASCGVTRSPGARADQLMLQGDQTHFVAKLLIEKYGLPKKFVEGADKALKKKK